MYPYLDVLRHLQAVDPAVYAPIQAALERAWQEIADALDRPMPTPAPPRWDIAAIRAYAKEWGAAVPRP